MPRPGRLPEKISAKSKFSTVGSCPYHSVLAFLLSTVMETTFCLLNKSFFPEGPGQGQQHPAAWEQVNKSVLTGIMPSPIRQAPSCPAEGRGSAPPLPPPASLAWSCALCPAFLPSSSCLGQTRPCDLSFCSPSRTCNPSANLLTLPSKQTQNSAGPHPSKGLLVSVTCTCACFCPGLSRGSTLKAMARATVLLKKLSF